MKHALRSRLAAYDLDGVVALARRRTRVLGALVPLTFDRDRLVAWRAVEAMGVAAECIQVRAPEAVREHLRRLHWLITEESGGICWRAPEAMAEIVARLPRDHEAFVLIVVHLLVETAEEDLEPFRAGMLWAVGRLGAVAAPHVADVVETMEACLGHPDPQVRGMAVWGLMRVGRADRVDALRGDDAGVELYVSGQLVQTTVAALIRRSGRIAPVSPRRASESR